MDAAAVARAAIPTPELTRHRIDEPVRELRILVDRRADVIRRRTTVINQLKAQLHVLLDYTPGDLPRTKTLALVRARVHEAALRAYVEWALPDMLTEVEDLNRRVRDLDTVIKELVSPLAPGLLQINRISHTSAAVLVAEIGDITRFPSSAKLARFTGCAPIPVYSSDNERHRLHRGGNCRLNSVLGGSTRWRP